MREYNNQDVKINENELDPCIAAEIRMKKALFSQRTRRYLLFLFIFIATVILFSVLLYFLLSRTSSKGTLQQQTNVSSLLSEINPKISHTSQNSLIASSSTIVINDSLAGIIDEPSPKVIEIDDNAFHENPMDNIDSISNSWSTATITATVTTTVTATVAASENIAKTSHLLMQPTSNTGINTTTVSPLIRIDKQTGESTTPPSFIDNDDEDDDDKAEDCKALLDKGKTENGIYQLFLPKIGKFNALCDMITNGGGWTVIQ
ncbi:hypothetical protein LOAG_13540, partial [Loa loa]